MMHGDRASLLFLLVNQKIAIEEFSPEQYNHVREVRER